MLLFIKNKIEYILLVCLYSWIGYCSIFNMGANAGIVFTILTILIALKSARASYCVMISLLFCSLASLNIPSPVLLSTAIFLLFNLRKINHNTNRHAVSKFILPCFLYLVIRCISCLQIVNMEQYISSVTVDLISTFSLVIGVIILGNSNDNEFIEKWVGYLGVLATIMGFVYFLYNDTAYLGQLYAGSDFAGKGVIGDDLIKAWLRWVPIDKEPNFWAAYLLFPYGYWIYSVFRKPGIENIICLLITFLGILFSYSRSSFIVSVLVLLYVLFKNKRVYFMGVTMLFVLFIISVFYFSPEIVERIFSINDNIKNEGGSGRFELWLEAINNFFSNPIFGVGTGQTVAVSKQHLGTHNLYLQILGENGLLGFCSFAYIWLCALSRMKRYIKYNSFYYYAFLGFSINLMTVHCFDLRIPFFIILLFYCTAYNRRNTPILNKQF